MTKKVKVRVDNRSGGAAVVFKSEHFTGRLPQKVTDIELPEKALDDFITKLTAQHPAITVEVIGRAPASVNVTNVKEQSPPADAVPEKTADKTSTTPADKKKSK